MIDTLARKKGILMISGVLSGLGTSRIACGSAVEGWHCPAFIMKGETVMRLKDKVILVTASTRGIGLAIVKACAHEGAAVYMAARDLARAREEADKLNARGYRVCCVYNDATKPESFPSMVEETVQHAGRIDVLVNNFGTSDPGRDLDFARTDAEVFMNTVQLNLRSVFTASQAAVKHMAAQGGGSIINISSVGGAGCFPDRLWRQQSGNQLPNQADRST